MPILPWGYLGILKRQVEDSNPWVSAIAMTLYSQLHPRREKFFTVPLGSSWVLRWRGRDFLVPREDAPYYFSGIFSEYCSPRFGVERGDIVLDVGAWVGGFTVWAAFSAGRVIAVEPHPLNLLYLRRNVAGLANVEVVGEALWRKKGRMRLFLGPSSVQHSLIAGKGNELEERRAWVWVRTETLDGLVSRLGLRRVDFLKMDVEGAEVEILRKGKKTLERTRKIAVAAYHRWKGEQTWPRVRERLEEAGFSTEVTEKGIVRGRKRDSQKFEGRGENLGSDLVASLRK
jgi:FkbM family methyltransferase